jgi:hypothetical protein
VPGGTKESEGSRNNPFPGQCCMSLLSCLRSWQLLSHRKPAFAGTSPVKRRAQRSDKRNAIQVNRVVENRNKKGYENNLERSSTLHSPSN